MNSQLIIQNKYIGKDISVIINDMRYKAIDDQIQKFSEKWFIPFEVVRYEVYNYKNGVIANANKLKESADYDAYNEAAEERLPKFKYHSEITKDFRNNLMPEVVELL